jgi:hypothetical protein
MLFVEWEGFICGSSLYMQCNLSKIVVIWHVTYNVTLFFCHILNVQVGTAVAQWLRYCATNRKVTSLISDGVIGIFH